MALIEMKDLVKQYMVGNEVIRALDEVSLQITEGEFLAIIGPSGSGKSTLMNLIGCLDVPDEGEYWLEGHCVADLTERQLSEIETGKSGSFFRDLIWCRNLVQRKIGLPLLYPGNTASGTKTPGTGGAGGSWPGKAEWNITRNQMSGGRLPSGLPLHAR